MEFRTLKQDPTGLQKFGHPDNATIVRPSELPVRRISTDQQSTRERSVIQNQEGSAFLITMALILMLSAVGIMALNQAGTEVDMSFNQVRRDQSLYLAEAGLSQAFADLNADWNWRTGYANQTLGNGEYSVAILDSSAGLAGGDTIIFQSTAFVPGDPGSNVTVESWVVPTRTRPFQYAIFSAWWLRIDGNGCTDSYNSDSGSYADTRADCCGAVGSNDELRLRDNVVINGDVFFGGDVSTDLEIGVGVTINGDTQLGVPPIDLPLVPQSEFDWAESINNAPAGLSGDFTWDAGQNKLTVGANDTMVLSSGVYYFGDVDVQAYGAIQLEPGAEVTIYSTAPIGISDNASINAGGKASALMILGNAASRFRTDDHAEFRGAYYAPESDMRVRHSSDIYGSVIVQRHTIDVGALNRPCFHYDRALANREMGPPDGYRVIAWRQL